MLNSKAIQENSVYFGTRKPLINQLLKHLQNSFKMKMHGVKKCKKTRINVALDKLKTEQGGVNIIWSF